MLKKFLIIVFFLCRFFRKILNIIEKIISFMIFSVFLGFIINLVGINIVDVFLVRVLCIVVKLWVLLLKIFIVINWEVFKFEIFMVML